MKNGVDVLKKIKKMNDQILKFILLTLIALLSITIYSIFSKSNSENLKIKSLEDEITSLKTRNDILQKKLDIIRSAL